MRKWVYGLDISAYVDYMRATVPSLDAAALNIGYTTRDQKFVEVVGADVQFIGYFKLGEQF